MYHKARDMLRKAQNANNGHCQTILGIRTHNIARICLNMDGQKNKSDNTTHLHWKSIPVKLLLKKGDDGRRTGTLFYTKKENKVRWGNALFFVKRGQLVVNCTKNTLKVPAKGIVQSIQQIKQDKVIDNDFDGFEEYNWYGSNSKWIEILSFNKFVFIRALGAARRLEVESKLGFLAIFNKGELVVEVTSTAFFFLFR